jgi:glycosyltransferase involved in cell wall biosynthesis
MTKPIRVLHVLANLHASGGAERMAVHIVRNLDPQRFETAVVSQSGPIGSDLEALLAKENILVEYLHKKPGFDFRIFRRLYKVIQRFAPDIIHTHVHVLRYAFPSMMILKLPIMLHTVHNLAQFEVEPRAQWLQKLAFKCGVVPVAVAHEVARSLTRLYGIPPSLVIGNCVPTELYAEPHTARAQWRSKEGFKSDDVLFVCVGRLSAQKNHALLVEAFSRCAATDAKAHLLLVGSGSLQEQVAESVKRRGLQDRVHFLGLRNDIPDILGASDIFALASDYEGNPLSVLEAMAAGLPIISTAAGGVPELFTHGEHGLMVKPGDVEGFSIAMMLLMDDPGLRERMGVSAAIRAVKNFDVSTMVAAYQNLYDTLIDRAGRRQASDGKLRVSPSISN